MFHFYVVDVAWLAFREAHEIEQYNDRFYTTIAALYAKICPQNLTDFYPHGFNSTPIIAYIFIRLHLANPLPLWGRFLRLSFVFYDKNHQKNHKCNESVSIGVIDQVLSANDDPNVLLQINR